MPTEVGLSKCRLSTQQIIFRITKKYPNILLGLVRLLHQLLAFNVQSYIKLARLFYLARLIDLCRHKTLSVTQLIRET